MTAFTAPAVPAQPRPAADGEPTPIWDALIAERGPNLRAAELGAIEAKADTVAHLLGLVDDQ